MTFIGRHRTRLAGCATAALALAVNNSAPAHCSISTSGLVFPAYDVFNNADTLGTGYVYVTCDAGVRYRITLSPGAHSTDPRSRRLGNARGELLSYNPYTSRNFLLVWDNGTNVYAGTGTGHSQAIPVYGRIPARQNASAGHYSDTITIVITSD